MRKVYSTKEVATILGVNYMTVYNLIQRGDLNAFKVGRHYKIKADELEKYIDDNEVS